MVFLLVCALYIIHQMDRAENLGIQNEQDVEHVSVAWMYFWVYIWVILPVVAIGLNYLQWTLHFGWVTQGGEVTTHPTKIVPKILQRDDFSSDVEAGKYVAMT